MIAELPVFTDPDQVLKIPLNGTVYQIRYYYVQRVDNWFFDLRDEDEVAIVLGIKIVPNYRLLEQYVLDNFKGDFICADIENNPQKNQKVTEEKFGSIFRFYYFSEDALEG